MATVKEEFNIIHEIKVELEKLNKKSVAIGVPNDADRQVIIRAGVHEFGSKVHKENAFIRNSFDNNKKEIQKIFEKGVNSITSGNKKADQVFEEVGKFVKNKIQQNIESAQLVDTGDMRDSIDYEVLKL